VSDDSVGTLDWEFGQHEEPDTAEEQLKLAGFYVGEGLYGIDIMRIKEVLQAKPYPLRPVPLAPKIIEGVIQLRGVVIPVIDLRKRFEVEAAQDDERLNKLIIVSVRGRIVGLKVDRVLGELRIPADSMRPAPSMLDGDENAESFFSGVCKVGDEMVFALNLEGLISTRGSG
jgi:purine-binding chemotaxis protein CheW